MVRFHGPVLPHSAISDVIAAGAPYFFVMNIAASFDACDQPLIIAFICSVLIFIPCMAMSCARTVVVATAHIASPVTTTNIRRPNMTTSQSVASDSLVSGAGVRCASRRRALARRPTMHLLRPDAVCMRDTRRLRSSTSTGCERRRPVQQRARNRPPARGIRFPRRSGQRRSGSRPLHLE